MHDYNVLNDKEEHIRLPAVYTIVTLKEPDHDESPIKPA